ncbi:MAG: diguanylate cyclase [Campylobacterales bacterium]|nr:diguanylate cyclase [Campylobacterales bacterium]
MQKFLVLVFMFVSSPLWAETSVFILHSYHEVYFWTKAQRIGFREVLNNAPNLYPLYSAEYLDTKRRSYDKNYEDDFLHYLKSKYKEYHPNIIYVTDDNALQFMLHHKEKIFPSVPVVFSGINDLSQQKKLDGSLYTGVFEKKEIRPNINLIKRLFPQEKEILLIGDGSSTAQAIRQNIENDGSVVPGIKIRYLNDKNFESVLNGLKEYKGKAIVLTTIGGFQTRNGHLMHLNQVINLIVHAGNFVILSLEDSYIQQGVIGGHADRGITQGSQAGKLALQILLHPGSPLPKMVQDSNEWIFDAQALKQYAIRLPDEIASHSIVLNPDKTFFQQHQELLQQLLYGLSGSIVLGSLLFSWYMQRSRKILRNREDELARISESLNRAQKIAHLGNWEWDIKRNALWWSDEIYRIFGLKPQEFKATYDEFLDRVYPDDRETVQEAVTYALTHNTPYHVIHRIITVDESVRYVLEEGELQNDDFGNPLKMLGVVHDITEQIHTQEILSESESKYRHLVENSMIGVYRADLSGNILYANLALAKIMGFDSPDELLNQNSLSMYASQKEKTKFLHTLLKEHDISGLELDVLDKHLDVVSIMISASLDGSVFSGMIVDMREIKQSRMQIDKLSKIVEQIDDNVILTDKEGAITFVNEAFCHHTGYVRTDILGKSPRIFKSGNHDSLFYEGLWRTILSGEVFRGIFINKKKNGDLYYEDKTITPLKDDKNIVIGFVSSGKDVTQETLLHQEIERIATIDNLTGIYNRHKFEELFVLETERSRRFTLPLSMIMIDIDHFKVVNDTYGHDIGDEVLKYLAKIVHNNIRKLDIFARWGGEEFLVLSPGIDLEDARTLAEKLRLAVEEATFPTIKKITISLGVSTFKKDDTFLELFKRADKGLYYAKEQGRNQVGV